MIKRIVMVLVMVVGAGFPRPNDEKGRGDRAPTGMVFASTMTDDGQPCPPECVTDSMEEELRLYPISEL